MKIFLNDIKSENLIIKKEIDEAISKIIESGKFINNKILTDFENNFANYCDKDFCIGTSSGSASLFVVLKCLDIKEGDEVIIPVTTFFATGSAISLAGATPIFIDVKKNCLIDENKIETAITKKTKAIIPVHLFGNVCEMGKIFKIAQKYNLTVIEDCAQAHGSAYRGKKVPVGEIGCFSFFPSKNLGAFGDAGAIVTSSLELERKIRLFINHGRSSKYVHKTMGFNFRQDAIQAAILSCKLKYLDEWIKKKQNLAHYYDKQLKLQKPFKEYFVDHSYHLYVIKTTNREKLKIYLDKNDVETGIYYPLPLHLQPAYSKLNYVKGDFPIAENLAEKVLAIPIYPNLKREDQQRIINLICKFTKTSENSIS